MPSDHNSSGELVLPIVEIKNRLKRLWFVDVKTYKVKRLDKYKGKLEKFDPNTFTAFDKDGKKIRVYATAKLATIASLKTQKVLKKEKWDELCSTIMMLNKDIEVLTDEIEKLEGDD